MICTRFLSKTYRTRKGSTDALKDVSVAIPPGVTALIGSNGSGKSTLMRLLCTLEEPSRGSFTVAGDVIAGKARTSYRQRIGYVPQDVHFVSTMTCKDALSYAGWVAGLNRPQYLARVPEVLSLVELSGTENARVGALSGGQTRRIGIAAALMHSPDILFFDEPTAGLDPHARIEVRRIVERLGTEATVVLSTHLSDDIESLSQHVIALHAGRVAFEGTWDELKSAARQEMEGLTTDDLESALAFIAGSAQRRG